MNAHRPLPLNEPQQRRLTVALASLERLLAELRRQLQQAPADLRLVRYEDRLDPRERAALLPLVCRVEARLGQMADALGLNPASESLRRGLVAGLELAAIHLHECRPAGGLKGCGAVAPATAQYLEGQLAQLETEVRALAGRLGQPAPPSPLVADG